MLAGHAPRTDAKSARSAKRVPVSCSNVGSAPAGGAASDPVAPSPSGDGVCGVGVRVPADPMPGESASGVAPVGGAVEPVGLAPLDEQPTSKGSATIEGK